MNNHIEVLLLLALPASGKSEARRYLGNLSPEQCEEQFGLGETVQLDDFPYVHIMRRVNDELTGRGHDGLFSISPFLPFRDPVDWLTLIELLNEDYADLTNGCHPTPESAALWLFDRIDTARERAGGQTLINTLPAALRADIAGPIEAEAAQLLHDKIQSIPTSLTGKTVVIEFARGCADGQTYPFPHPYGYQASLAQLSHEILSRSNILYIWVDPAESRRKNAARSDPNDPGSILNHGVPLSVMYGDYGACDMAHLLAQSRVENNVIVKTRGETYCLPVGRFDNRVDKTSFVRQEPETWQDQDITALKEGLRRAFDDLDRGRNIKQNRKDSVTAANAQPPTPR